MTRPIRLALAAVAACASSRCSSAARHPAINHRGARSRSGSIRHDHARRPPESRSFVNRSIGRSRASASRAHQIRSSSARSSPASNNNGSNQRPSLNPKRPNRYRATTVDCRRSVRYSQIPIARHRCSGPISRGFLPWRLSDDGPAACRRAHNGAVVRNPSQYPPSRPTVRHALLQSRMNSV